MLGKYGWQPWGYKIEFNDRTPTLVAKLIKDQTAPIHPELIRMNWSTHNLGGCGAAMLEIKKDGLQGTPLRGHTVKINVGRPESTSYAFHYQGTIVETPVYTQNNTVIYKAFGFWMQVESQHVVKYYAGKPVDDIVKDILADIDTPNSDISTSTAKISIGAPYTPSDVEAEYVTAASLIKTLALIQGNVEYGVEPNGQFYFRDKVVTSDDRVYYEGQHFAEVDIREISDRVVNRLYMRSKEVVGGGQLTLKRDDTTSSTKIADIGIRSAVVDIPHIRTHADIWRYAQYYLAEHGAQNISDVKIGPILDFIWPSGWVTLRNKAGTNVAQVPIESVTYEYDEDGFRGYLHLGPAPAPIFGTEMQALLRHLENERSAQVSNIKIDHSRGEEWAQDLIIDARKAEMLNQFYDTFSDIKAIDLSLSRKMFHADKHYYVGAGQESPLNAVVVSNEIPTGEDFDDVRVYLDVDLDGTIQFDRDADFDNSFIQVNTWELDGTNQRAINTIPDAFLELLQTPSRPYAVAGYTIEFAFDNVDVAFGNPWRFCWSRLDGLNFNYIEMLNQGGPNRTTIDLYAMIGGVPTSSLGTITGAFQQNMRVEIIARNLGPPNTTVTAWDKTTDVLIGSVNTALLGLTAAYKVGPTDWYGSIPFPNIAELDWIKPDTEIGGIVVEVSRTNGANWTSVGAVLDGQNSYDVDISGQPSGNQLRLRSTMDWPTRLYSWGVAF